MADGTGDLEATLAQARRMLDSLAAGDAAAEPVTGEGSALDGLVTVRATGGGRIEWVEIDPRAGRVPLDQLAEAITEAVNAALAEASGSGALPVDFGALAGQVRQMQDDSLRQMARFTGALDEAMDRLGKRP
ncbi:YbaB/EbfC family nucleoid-associated protein [Asanoa sp. NPDC049573]|uniref:YbaB/EbfC family nucleoid-associated protein n=1 Tax=Asanoa sp. NPDC049573 TaxID=3155396 RepID=UPI0034499AA5